MGYVNKTYLSTQFKNFADKIAKVFSKIGHTHLKSDITDFPTSMPANGGNAATVGGHTVGVNVPSNAKFTDTTYSKLSEFTDDVGYVKDTDSRLSDARNAKDVYAWAKASKKPSYTKAEVGLGNVDNTADSAKNVKYAASAGSADKVPWSGVTGKPTTYTPRSHTHDDRYYTETEIDTKLKTKSNTKTYISNNGEGISIAPTSLTTPDGLQHINYTLDILPATSETIGGVKVGNTLTIDNGILNAKPIGIKGADTESCITTFVSDDSLTGSSTAPAVITSGETHKSLFNKLSTAVKNVRWLLSKMGTTDISAIGNGTVTGALSTLNLNKQDKNCYIYNVKYMEFLSMQNRSEIKWKISDTESYLVQFLNDGHIGYFHSTDNENNWQTIFMK